MTSVKVWQQHDDKTLAILCQMLTERKLYKVILSSQPLENLLEEKENIAKRLLGINDENLHYFVSVGTTSNNTYNINDERIRIAMKDGSTKDISEIDNPIVNQALARPVHKNYICYLRHEA